MESTWSSSVRSPRRPCCHTRSAICFAHAGPSQLLADILDIIQNLINQKPKTQVNILYAYQGTGINRCLKEALAGFAKTLRLEHPKFIFKTVGFESFEDAGFIIEKIEDELLTDDQEIEVKYKSGQKFIKKYREFDIEKQGANHLPIKENGTYLITGGMGGLGLIFAKYLSEKCFNIFAFI